MGDFFSSFGIIFMVFMGVIMALIFLLRMAKYGSVFGSFASTMQGGIVIIDQNGTGSVAECVGWDQNEETGKIRLRLNYIDKFQEGKTPFIFDEEDFCPTLSQINWEHYAGTIKLYWDFERRRDYRNVEVKNLTTQVDTLKQQSAIYRRASKSLLEYFEREKVTEKKESSDIRFAKAYKTVKSIVDETVVDTGVSNNPDDTMFD